MELPLNEPEIHDAANLFPMLAPDELQALADDIARHGQRDPIDLYEGKILDGRNRWKACGFAGVEPATRTLTAADVGESPTAYVLSKNLRRRHLNPAQRAALAVEIEDLFAAEARERQAAAGRTTAAGKQLGGKVPPSEKAKRDESKRATSQAAKAAGAGQKATNKTRAVRAKAPEVIEAVKAGEVKTVEDARRLADMPDEERAEALDAVRSGAAVKDAIAAASKPGDDPLHRFLFLRGHSDRLVRHLRDAEREWKAVVKAAEAYHAERGSVPIGQALFRELRGYFDGPTSHTGTMIYAAKRLTPYSVCGKCDGAGCVHCDGGGWIGETEAMQAQKDASSIAAARQGSK